MSYEFQDPKEYNGISIMHIGSMVMISEKCKLKEYSHTNGTT